MFGVRDGRLIDPARYMLNLVSPFSLLCRSDEGPPVKLSAGDRYVYDVAGTEATLKAVLAKPFVFEPQSYRLPDAMAYSVSSAAGAKPEETWSALQGLEREGSISRLEKDPCWQFLPQSGTLGANASCVPGVREFPEKAVRVSQDFGATLGGRYMPMPVSDAWVHYGPLSPSPYFNPGDRAGDELPPTFVRTGLDGMYRAPLGTLTGPVEIGVTKGCAQHTTVVIAEGASAPSVAGITTGSKPRPGPMSSAPPAEALPAPRSTQKPSENARVCGPDVTDQVLDALKLMWETYASWDYSTRYGKCVVLYNPIKFQAAWDMVLFTPSDRGVDDPKHGEYMPHILFQRAAPGVCAIPRWPCGETVEFLGQCIPAQVVNYVQWGAMNELCDNQVFGRAANLARSGSSNAYAGQHAMSVVGEHFVAGSGDMAARKASMKRMLEGMIKEKGADWAKLDGVDCPLTCDIATSGAKPWLDNAAFGFQWGDVTLTTRDVRVAKELKELEERKKQQGKK